MREASKFTRTEAGSEAEGVFKKIDRKSPEIVSALAEAPVYKKVATIKARKAIPGEQITTILKDGRVETLKEATEGDWVITNPSGEQYINNEEIFNRRYLATDEEGVYMSNGYARAIKNPFGVPIEILASWGEPQYGDEHCLLIDICDENGDNLAGEPYIIDEDAFNETYK